MGEEAGGEEIPDEGVIEEMIAEELAEFGGWGGGWGSGGVRDDGEGDLDEAPATDQGGGGRWGGREMGEVEAGDGDGVAMEEGEIEVIEVAFRAPA